MGSFEIKSSTDFQITFPKDIEHFAFNGFISSISLKELLSLLPNVKYYNFSCYVYQVNFSEPMDFPENLSKLECVDIGIVMKISEDQQYAKSLRKVICVNDPIYLPGEIRNQPQSRYVAIKS